MLIALDAGNSTIGVALFEEALAAAYSLPTDAQLSQGQYERLLRNITEGYGSQPEGAIISSVAPSCTAALVGALKAICNTSPMMLGADTLRGMALEIDLPSSLGPDRIAAAAGAVARLGAPVAVVDFGTATTVNFVMPREGVKFGAYVGGAIMPGLALQARSLNRGTERLPLIELEGTVEAIGKDTVTNIRTGIVAGSAGAVMHIIEQAGKELGVQFHVAVTGGAMSLVLPHMGPVELADAHLTLKGLRMLYLEAMKNGLPA